MAKRKNSTDDWEEGRSFCFVRHAQACGIGNMFFFSRIRHCDVIIFLIHNFKEQLFFANSKIADFQCAHQWQDIMRQLTNWNRLCENHELNQMTRARLYTTSLDLEILDAWTSNKSQFGHLLMLGD